MEKKENIGTSILTSVIIACWFMLSLFVKSKHFVNEENDVKYHIFIVGLMILSFYAIFINKRPTHFLSSIFSELTINLLFIVGSILSIYGLLQYGGLFKSYNSSFRITGSFENPAGVAAVLSILFPIGITCVFRTGGLKKIIYAILSCCYIITIILTGSRTGILSIFVTLTIVIQMEKNVMQWFRTHINFLILLITTIIATFIFLYLWKTDSVSGRLLIWFISFSIIKKRPIFGFGPNGFDTQYMMAQADYFRSNTISDYSLLADNIKHPFNEFILTTINYGIIGLLLFLSLITILIMLSLKSRDNYSTILLPSLTSFVIFSTFSYPLHYAPIWLLLLFICIKVLFFNKKLSRHLWRIKLLFKNLFLKTAIALLLFMISFFQIHLIISQIKWKHISDCSIMGQTEQMIPLYEKLYHKTFLKYNKDFLYNYAAELNFIDRYSESIQILDRCKDYLFDYEVALAYTDNYLNLHKYPQALRYAQLASNMVPCRFYPHYYLMTIYKESGDFDSAVKEASLILEKPIKVPSDDVFWVRNEAESLINEIVTHKTM